MTESTLKSVFTLETESQTYKPIAHNLNASEAVEQFNADPRARSTDQPERHRTPDAAKCKICKKAAEGLTSAHAETLSGAEQADAEALSAQESESD